MASEPSTYKEKDWTLIGKNCVLIVEDDGTGCARKTPYHEAWNARSEGDAPPSRGSSISGASASESRLSVADSRHSVADSRVSYVERGSLAALNGKGKGLGRH